MVQVIIIRLQLSLCVCPFFCGQYMLQTNSMTSFILRNCVFFLHMCVSNDSLFSQYCLSGHPTLPCNVLKFKSTTIMLDCGLDTTSVLTFLPLPLVHRWVPSFIHSFIPLLKTCLYELKCVFVPFSVQDSQSYLVGSQRMEQLTWKRCEKLMLFLLCLIHWALIVSGLQPVCKCWFVRWT